MVSLWIAAELFGSGCKGICDPPKVAMPGNPCPEYVDLMKDVAERGRFDPFEEADRNACLINWMKRMQAVGVWEQN